MLHRTEEGFIFLRPSKNCGRRDFDSKGYFRYYPALVFGEEEMASNTKKRKATRGNRDNKKIAKRRKKQAKAMAKEIAAMEASK